MSTDELQEAIEKIAAMTTSRTERTMRITTTVVDSLRSQGYQVELEYVLPDATFRHWKSGRPKQARFDIAVFSEGKPVTFIEIDGGNKGWSLGKLRAGVSRGVPGIWIRHGGTKPRHKITSGISLVYVR